MTNHRQCASIAQARGMRKARLLLLVGGLFEVGFTTSLRFAAGFRNLPWTAPSFPIAIVVLAKAAM